MILTSAPRSGGEVGITEAERSRRIHPGRRGAEPEPPCAAPPGRPLHCAVVTRPLRGVGAAGSREHPPPVIGFTQSTLPRCCVSFLVETRPYTF